MDQRITEIKRIFCLTEWDIARDKWSFKPMTIVGVRIDLAGHHDGDQELRLIRAAGYTSAC